MKYSYWILPHPGVNAVFYGASETLSLAELTLCLRTLDANASDPVAQTDAALRWYAFDTDAPLSPGDISRLSALSSLYALFERKESAFYPIASTFAAPFGEDLSGILKYTGKTNALFTRLMLHVAALSLENPPQWRPLRLLDPVAGKGTTLFEGLMRGWDVSGVEIVQKAAHESAVYFQKYLETEKWKHKQEKVKSYGAHTWRMAFARDKEALKATPGHWTMVAGDSKFADRYFGKAAFDLVCGDLPYGVAHGNIVGASQSRKPDALLHACLPAWHRVLRPQGILSLSWNTFVLPVVDMISILTSHGFVCLRDAPYDALLHRVDASIQRDIVVARKQG